jgi:hypothetical protein
LAFRNSPEVLTSSAGFVMRFRSVKSHDGLGLACHAAPHNATEFPNAQMDAGLRRRFDTWLAHRRQDSRRLPLLGA